GVVDGLYMGSGWGIGHVSRSLSQGGSPLLSFLVDVIGKKDRQTDARNAKLQGHRDSDPCRPFQTRPRLRPVPTRHPPRRRDALFGSAAAAQGVVALHGGGERCVGHTGHVGLPLSPAAADIVWRGGCL